MGLLSGSQGPKIAQFEKIYDFLALSEHFHFKNLVLNTFSGSKILWRLLGEYEALVVLFC